MNVFGSFRCRLQ